MASRESIKGLMKPDSPLTSNVLTNANPHRD